MWQAAIEKQKALGQQKYTCCQSVTELINHFAFENKLFRKRKR